MELFKIFGTLGLNGVNETNSQLKAVTGTAKNASSGMGAAFKKIGTAVAAAFAVDKIIDFGKSIVNAAAEVGAEQSAFEQIMGDYVDTATAKVAEVADATGMVSTRLTPYMTSMTAKFKGLGYDIDDATTFAQRGLTLAADAAAFWDKSLDDSMGHLNSFINGSYEGGEAIGLFANDTQMAMYAVEQGIVSTTKEWANLDEATKQATRLQYAENMFALSGASGQAAKEAEQFANVQANLNEKWRQFKALIGEPLLQNVVTPAMAALSTTIDVLSTGFQNLSTWVKENQTAISNIITVVEIATAAFLALKTGMMIQNVVRGFQSAQVAISLLSLEIGGANLAQAALNGTLTIGETIVGLLTGKIKLATVAQGLMTTAQTALNTVMSANPIGIVIGLIVALVAAFVILWNKSEGFRNFWINLWEGIKSTTATVIETIKTFFTGLGENIQSIWEGIKNTFSSIGEWVDTNIVQPVIEFFTGMWESIQEIWSTICNVVQVGIMLIGEIISAAVQIITLPFMFIWENCKEYVFAAWEWIKEKVGTAIDFVANVISTKWEIIKTVTSTVWEAIKNVFTTVWNAIVDFVTPILETIKTVISTKWETIKSIVSSVVNTIKTVISTVWNAIKTTVTNVMNGIKTTISNVWNTIKTTVSNAVNNVKTTISDKLNEAKRTVSDILESIKEKFRSIFEKAKSIVKDAIEAIKEKFNFTWSLPKLKLPHINISGSFSLNPPSVPSFGIDWYKKAMENPMWLDSPTIFGMNPSGKLLGGGEAGDEVVAGAAKLKSMIADGVREETGNLSYKIDRLIDMLAEYMPEVIKNMKRELVLDSGTLVGQLAPAMDGRLGDINELRKRGN